MRALFKGGLAALLWLMAAALAVGYGALCTSRGHSASLAVLCLIAMLGPMMAGVLLRPHLETLALGRVFGSACVAATCVYATLAGCLGRFVSLENTALYEALVANPWAKTPGERLLGPLWDRAIVLYAGLGILVQLLAVSSSLLRERNTGRHAYQFKISRPNVALRMAWAHLFYEGLPNTTAQVAMLGVSLGVGALVVVTAVMSGYQRDIKAKILSTNAHVVVQKYGVDFVEYEKLIEQMAHVDGVVAAAPFAFSEALIATRQMPQLARGALIKGVPIKDIGAHTDLQGKDASLEVTDINHSLCWPQGLEIGQKAMCEARHDLTLDALLRPDAQLPKVIVGLDIFRRLQLPVGAHVILTTPTAMAGHKSDAPKAKAFVLAGAFQSGLHEFDSRLAFVALPAAQALFGLGKAVTGVEVKLNDADQCTKIGHDILQAIGRYPYRLVDWRELNLGIFVALSLQKVIMFLVLGFIVIVAAFNMASVLYMAVVERAPHIAVLKVMGASNALVMRTFVWQGLIVGGLGTLLGLGLGLVVSYLLGALGMALAPDVYMVDTLSVCINPSEVFVACFFALSICHLATLYPAMRAAGQPVLKLLRAD